MQNLSLKEKKNANNSPQTQQNTAEAESLGDLYYSVERNFQILPQYFCCTEHPASLNASRVRIRSRVNRGTTCAPKQSLTERFPATLFFIFLFLPVFNTG